MWVFRIAGVLVLACSGFAAAHELNRRSTAALKQTEGLMRLLRTVRGQIACFARPIPEILRACEPSVLAACGYTKQESPPDLFALLSHSTVYDAPSVGIVWHFAEEFGRGYREDEVRACDYALSLLEERRTSLCADLPIRKKRNTALCVCAALALALLLL